MTVDQTPADEILEAIDNLHIAFSRAGLRRPVALTLADQDEIQGLKRIFHQDYPHTVSFDPDRMNKTSIHGLGIMAPT